MDSSWNSVTTDQATLQQIAQNLGYSVDDLPPVNSLSTDQVATLVVEFGDAVDFSNVKSSGGGDPSSPQLDPPEVDHKQLPLDVQTLMAEIKNLMMKMVSTITDADKADMRKATADRIKKLQDAFKKIAHSKKSGFWSKFAAWAGTIAGVIGAIALTVVTGGAAAPALCVALFALGVQIAQATGGMDKLENAMFGKDNQKAKLIFSICLTATILIAGLVTGYGAAKAASSLTEISSMCQGIADLAEVSGEAVQAGAKTVGVGAGIVGILAGLGGGAAEIDSSIAAFGAKDDQTAINKLIALLEQLEDDLKDQNAKFKRIFQKYFQDGVQLPNEMIDGMHQTNMAITAANPA